MNYNRWQRANKKVRICMVGCGWVANLYVPIFKYLQEGELVAVVDVNKEAAERVANKYNVKKIYTDINDAAKDKEIDAFIIGTPPNLHALHVEIVANEGKHVLCEKPMAWTAADCLRMIEVCKKNNVKLQIAHMKRFMLGNQVVKNVINSGVLGKIFMAECHWDCAVPQIIDTYRDKEGTGGGNLLDHGPHAFDLIRWWTGNDIVEVSASVHSIHPLRPNEDTAVVVIEHENGMLSFHHMTRISYGKEHWQDNYRIYGTEGTLVVRNNHHFPTASLEPPEIVLYSSGGFIQRLEPYHPWNLDDTVIQFNPFYNQLKAFCESILYNTTPLVTGEDGLHVIEAVMAAYVSSLKGIKVKLPFREEIDLVQLLKEMKKRDEKNLGYNYSVACGIKGPIQVEIPEYSHHPLPRKSKKVVR